MLATRLFAGVHVDVERYALPRFRLLTAVLAEDDRVILAFKLNLSLSSFDVRNALSGCDDAYLIYERVKP